MKPKLPPFTIVDTSESKAGGARRLRVKVVMGAHDLFGAHDVALDVAKRYRAYKDIVFVNIHIRADGPAMCRAQFIRRSLHGTLRPRPMTGRKIDRHSVLGGIIEVEQPTVFT